MRPEFSEFSFGYALTEALVNGRQHVVRPTFPTQRQERHDGYDLRFDRPGGPIFLQFKLCHGMTRRTAREYADFGLPLNFPFLRMPLMASRFSPQHSLLLDLENCGEAVFYAAPRFFHDNHFAEYYGDRVILPNSAFIRPSAIGNLPDDGDHHVSFDCHARHGWFLSEPIAVKPILNGNDFQENIYKILHDEYPMSNRIKIALINLTNSIIGGATKHHGQIFTRGTIRRLCLDVRRVYPDFPEPDTIFNAPVPTGEQALVTSAGSPDRWSISFQRELRTLLEETGSPEHNAALLGSLAQLHCGATVILVAQQTDHR